MILDFQKPKPCGIDRGDDVLQNLNEAMGNCAFKNVRVIWNQVVIMPGRDDKIYSETLFVQIENRIINRWLAVTATFFQRLRSKDVSPHLERQFSKYRNLESCSVFR